MGNATIMLNRSAKPIKADCHQNYRRDKFDIKQESLKLLLGDYSNLVTFCHGYGTELFILPYRN